MAMLCSARLTARPVAAARPVALRVPIARPHTARGLVPLKPATPARPAPQPKRLSVTAAAQPAATPAAPQGKRRTNRLAATFGALLPRPPPQFVPSDPTLPPASYSSPPGRT